MRRNPRETTSLWHLHEKGIHPLSFSSLQENIFCDVCVVGAGIGGLTAAYFLQKQGKSVIIAEAWDLASGETCRTTAHITSAFDDGYCALEKLFSKEDIRLFKDSHIAAIDMIESIVREEGIKCDFERLDGYLTAMAKEQEKDLEDETEAYRRAGFKTLRSLPHIPISQISSGPALHFPEQATFNIAYYMQGLAKAFLKYGGRIYTRTRVIDARDGDRPYVLTEDGFRIDATSVIIATHMPMIDRVKMHTKQAAYRSYVLAFRIPKDSYPGFLFWDLEDPYHYARLARGKHEDYLIIGGEDHKTGQANNAQERWKKVEEWSRTYFSGLGDIVTRWSGQIIEPIDHLAFIGRNPGDKNIYIITGDSGNGITHCTIAGMLLPDLIDGRQNPWEKIYDPARVNPKAAQTYLKENSNAVGCLVSDWVAPGDVKDIRDIPENHGAVMRDGVSKSAIFRDEDGTLYKCSAVCTHLDCIVQWNSGEKSWDCPCHGSRFDVEGTILNGPAVKGLKEVFEGDHPAESATWIPESPDPRR